jgi:hypothetical protein
MGAAIDATVRDLGKPRCEREADYEALIRVMEKSYTKRIGRVLTDGLAQGSSIDSSIP